MENRPIVAVAGDGGLCQYHAEITTLVKYNIPVKLIVVNNNELGKISKEQRAGGWQAWATDLVNTNFADFAKSCGAFGLRITKKESLESGLQSLFNHKGPGLVEIIADVNLI